MLTVGSLFSGIGGFDLGFERAGFETRWRCEIEPFCRRILSAKLAEADLFEDVTVMGLDVPHVDVLLAGFPCQDVSVAGKRAGLAGARTGLFFELIRLLRLLQPSWWVLENVPGLLSSHQGRDFAAVLGALDECGYVGGWRILDSQYFGLAQRRERVFLVGGAGRFRECAQTILFESESGNGHPAARTEAGARVAATLRGRSHGAGVNEPGRGGEDDSNLVCGPLGGGNDGIGRRSEDDPNLVFATLNSGGNSGGFRTEPGEHLVAAGERARALVGSMHKRHDDDTDTLIPTLTGNLGHHGYGSDRGDGSSVIAAFAENQRGELRLKNTADSLKSGGGKPGQGYSAALTAAGVRRLTPLECERLQGFPDGWTCLCGEGHRGSQFCRCKDTPRYKALGNAVSVPVAQWVAERIKDAEERLSHE